MIEWSAINRQDVTIQKNGRIHFVPLFLCRGTDDTPSVPTVALGSTTRSRAPVQPSATQPYEIHDKKCLRISLHHLFLILILICLVRLVAHRFAWLRPRTASKISRMILWLLKVVTSEINIKDLRFLWS